MVKLPDSLLLATDLSARCDRALDRAAMLAQEWRAELVVLNVLEVPQSPDLTLRWALTDGEVDCAGIARRQLRRDLRSASVRASLRIASGDAAQAICAAAEAEACGLVVTGMGRDETLGRFLLGSTVQRLLRMAVPPVLVVRNRPYADYRSIVVACDFSTSARYALELAIAYFPRSEITLFHAHESPATLPIGADDRRILGSTLEQERVDPFLAGCEIGEEARRHLRVSIAFGPIETLLASHVRDAETDLVVLGTRGAGGIRGLLLGSTAARMMDWLPCDSLIVRAPGHGD